MPEWTLAEGEAVLPRELRPDGVREGLRVELVPERRRGLVAPPDLRGDAVVERGGAEQGLDLPQDLIRSTPVGLIHSPS